MGRQYDLSTEARKQRSDAAKARWAGMSKAERSEALKPAYTSEAVGWTPGRTRKKAKLRRAAVRDPLTGRFAKIL